MDQTVVKGQRDPNPRDIPLGLADWIAECQSLQPDHSLWIRTVGSSWDALCLIFILTHISSLPWITDDITRRIAQKAYQANYEGEWETVQFLLEQNLQTPEQFYRYFLERHSPEEFFGNLRKRAMRVLYLVRTVKRDPHGSYVRPQRIRGYRDKGTYHPPHEFHGDPPERDQKVDRRHLVRHPLLYDP